MSLPDSLSAEQASQLAEELSVLSKEQSVALQVAPYAQMSVEEAKRYDLGRIRIEEICALLVKFQFR
ncbi:MAG TPA: hypothetical protein VGF44_15375 [Terriglobales bacterium]